jgi:hypothetical protein
VSLSPTVLLTNVANVNDPLDAKLKFGGKVCLLFVESIDIESLQNRLLKVCYVPTTSAGLPRLLFLLQL